MVDVIEELRSQWDVNVVAFTTNASGESKKARKMLLARFPHLVCPDCYAHQVSNLRNPCKIVQPIEKSRYRSISLSAMMRRRRGSTRRYAHSEDLETGVRCSGATDRRADGATTCALQPPL